MMGCCGGGKRIALRRMKARRALVCFECDDRIAPGEIYFRSATPTSVCCEECHDAAVLLASLGFWWEPGGLERVWRNAWRGRGC